MLGENDEYRLRIERDPFSLYGAGEAILIQNEEAVGSWPVITGGKEHDSKKYGGVTPPIKWDMIERIEKRGHPDGRVWEHAKIYPVDPKDIEVYKNRTFSLDCVPFMIHAMGRSTGCIGPRHVYWKDFRDELNRAWEENGGSLIIDVVDDE